jgi:hypothetical protein
MATDIAMGIITIIIPIIDTADIITGIITTTAIQAIIIMIMAIATITITVDTITIGNLISPTTVRSTP